MKKMNREILFRGKQIVSGEWIYGVPISNDNITCIFKLTDGLSELKGFQVKPETVGQYTGLIDKNGVKIFEGDIASFKRFENNYVGKIIFNNKTAGFEFWWNVVVGAYGEKATRCANLSVCDEIEVIGNIHDDSEMLGD